MVKYSSKPKREDLEKDGLYALIKDENGNELLFRKFDSAIYIASIDGFTEKVNGLVRVSSEQLKTILNAPTIKQGDGETPQSI